MGKSFYFARKLQVIRFTPAVTFPHRPPGEKRSPLAGLCATGGTGRAPQANSDFLAIYAKKPSSAAIQLLANWENTIPERLATRPFHANV